MKKRTRKITEPTREEKIRQTWLDHIKQDSRARRMSPRGDSLDVTAVIHALFAEGLRWQIESVDGEEDLSDLVLAPGELVYDRYHQKAFLGDGLSPRRNLRPLGALGQDFHWEELSASEIAQKLWELLRQTMSIGEKRELILRGAVYQEFCHSRLRDPDFSFFEGEALAEDSVLYALGLRHAPSNAGGFFRTIGKQRGLSPVIEPWMMRAHQHSVHFPVMDPGARMTSGKVHTLWASSTGHQTRQTVAENYFSHELRPRSICVLCIYRTK